MDKKDKEESMLKKLNSLFGRKSENKEGLVPTSLDEYNARNMQEKIKEYAAQKAIEEKQREEKLQKKKDAEKNKEKSTKQRLNETYSFEEHNMNEPPKKQSTPLSKIKNKILKGWSK